MLSELQILDSARKHDPVLEVRIVCFKYSINADSIWFVCLIFLIQTHYAIAAIITELFNSE